MRIAERALSSSIATALILVCAAWVGSLAVVRAYADSAYRTGLGYTEFPAADVPGRLAAYDEAHRRAPNTFIYLLRSGQIHMARASLDEDGSEHLRIAGERLRRAVRINPLDARARISLGQVLLLEGAREAAFDEARVAISLGPRHPSVQLGALRLGIEAWHRYGDLDGFALALDAEVLRSSWSVIHGPAISTRAPRFVMAAVRARHDSLLGDVLEAAGDDAGRLAVAREWCALDRQDLLGVLDARLRRLSANESRE